LKTIIIEQKNKEEMNNEIRTSQATARPLVVCYRRDARRLSEWETAI